LFVFNPTVLPPLHFIDQMMSDKAAGELSSEQVAVIIFLFLE